MDTTNIERIQKKLQTDWADWTNDDDNQCITICKKELMVAIQGTQRLSREL